MSYDELFSMEPEEFAQFLISRFLIKTPEKLDTIEELKEASPIGLKLNSYYSYLRVLSIYADLKTRFITKADPGYKDAMSKKKTIEALMDVVNKQYAAISRAVTIYNLALDEQKMLKYAP